jgi:molybdate transport system ATP-binding protein
MTSETDRSAPETSTDTAAHAGLSVDITAVRPGFAVTAAFEVPAGSTLALLGPNGAGKSTILSVIAGLLVPQQGTVRVGDRVLTRVGPVERVQVSPEHRRIGVMGQNPLLFPHLSAVENVAFGPRSQGRGRTAARREAADWLDRLGLAAFARRRPRELSGGQAQRVALARALAAGPELLLLDEPLGALDAGTAPEVRQMLRTSLLGRGTTAVLVTHDSLDAAVLADIAVVVENGRVTDRGPVSQVLQAPRSTFGAALAGLNLLAGTAETEAEAGHPVQVQAGPHRVIGLASAAVTAGAQVAAVFAPSTVTVRLGEVGPASPRNVWPATVRSLQALSGRVRVDTVPPEVGNAGNGGNVENTARGAALAADLTASAVAELELLPGTDVVLEVKANQIAVHPR